jgi:hypothetical protein
MHCFAPNVSPNLKLPIANDIQHERWVPGTPREMAHTKDTNETAQALRSWVPRFPVEDSESPIFRRFGLPVWGPADSGANGSLPLEQGAKGLSRIRIRSREQVVVIFFDP